MELQLLDPVTGVPIPAAGVGGKVITSLPANSMAVTPSDTPGEPGAFFTKPAQIWVGDAATVNVTVIPYGLEGDKQVTFPAIMGMTLPVLVKQVLATGTTAATLRAQW